MSKRKGYFLQTISCISILVASFSCSQYPKKKISKTHDSIVVVQVKPTGSSDELNTRGLLIKELKKLSVAFASNDKNQIRQIFHFPIYDSILSLVTAIDDSTFRREYEKNSGLTEGMFENHFTRVCSDWRLNELNKLFKYLPLDSLQQKDSLTYYDIKVKEPCLKQYFLIVKGNLVMINYGTNGNPGYKGKKSDEDFGDECEYDTYWEFLFNGKTLVFKRQVVAG